MPQFRQRRAQIGVAEFAVEPVTDGGRNDARKSGAVLKVMVAVDDWHFLRHSPSQSTAAAPSRWCVAETR